MKAFRKPIALLVALLMAIIPFCGFAEAGPVRTELDDALNVPGGTLSFSDGGTEYPMQAVTVDERVCAKTTNQTVGRATSSVTLTASVAAGTICETVLNGLGVKVYTHIAECAGVQDAPLSSAAGLVMPDPQPGHFALLDASKEEAMQAAIRAAGSEGDSVGGILETIVTGLPAGIGEPWFDSVESELAHLMFAIPACKGIEFGAGFGFAAMHGSEANDPFTMRDGKIATATNKNGGINGGITNGMPIVFRTVLKPTPSIYKQQHTVDYIGRTDAELQIKGRHDPCIVPRAAVVQNSLTAFGLLDLLTVRYGTLAQKHGFPKV